MGKLAMGAGLPMCSLLLEGLTSSISQIQHVHRDAYTDRTRFKRKWQRLFLEKKNSALGRNKKFDERLLRLLLRQWAELLLCQRFSANDQNLFNGRRGQKKRSAERRRDETVSRRVRQRNWCGWCQEVNFTLASRKRIYRRMSARFRPPFDTPRT